MSSPVDAHSERLVMERMVLFTDAVFAIVITLMAIDIRLPAAHPAGGWTELELGHALAELAPKLLAYFISFAVVSLIWTGHLRKYRHLRSIDGVVLWLNPGPAAVHRAPAVLHIVARRGLEPPGNHDLCRQPCRRRPGRPAGMAACLGLTRHGCIVDDTRNCVDASLASRWRWF